MKGNNGIEPEVEPRVMGQGFPHSLASCPMDPAPYRKLSNEAHRKLDEVVLSEIAWLLGGPNAVPLPTTLLGTIVACAPQCLAQDRSELQSKYAAHKDKFDDLLLNCWNMKSFARVRNLGEPLHHVARSNPSRVLCLSNLASNSASSDRRF